MVTIAMVSEVSHLQTVYQQAFQLLRLLVTCFQSLKEAASGEAHRDTDRHEDRHTCRRHLGVTGLDVADVGGATPFISFPIGCSAFTISPFC